MAVALIDGDIVAYRCSASAEKDDEGIALIRADRLLTDIISVTDASEIKLFLSGSSNFRYDVYPEYKGNRKDMKRPKHLQRTREYLVLEWGAEMTDGYEADDALGIAAGTVGSSIVCSIDKDLKQIPGNHYNFVTGEFSYIEEIEGWRNFYRQLVLGDRGDNIPGYDGKMRLKFPKFLSEIREKLEGARSVVEMAQAVRLIYPDETTLIRNGKLLYLWRELNDPFTVKMHLETSPEPKAVEEVSSDSTQTKLVVTIPSTERGGTKQKKGGYQRRGQSKGSVSRKSSRAR